MPLAKCWKKRIPSLNPHAFRKLKEIVAKKSRVFEFGTGGSTVWLAHRVGELVSVEHDREWFRILREGMTADFGKIPENTTLILRTGTSILNDVWIESETTGEAIGLDYITSILDYPDNHFDIVAVDGRARIACLGYSLLKVKPGGFVLFDDSQRECYQEGWSMMDGWKATTYRGEKNTPYEMNQSIFFRRPL